MHHLLPTILLLLPALGWCLDEYGLPDAKPSEGDENTWYQVELLEFADSRFDHASEHWPEVDAYYPANMVIVGGKPTDGAMPASLWQLADLQEYEALLGPRDLTGGSNVREREPELLFEEYSRRRPRDRNFTTLSDQDLITGLTFDQPSADESVSLEASADSATGDGSSTNAIGVSLEELFDDDRSAAFRALDSDGYHLGTFRTRLMRSRNYRVLYHRAWQQPIPSSEIARPLLIQGGDRFDDRYELDGTITISRARFLHLDTRLWYTTFDRVSAGPGAQAIDLRQLRTSDLDLAKDYPELYQYEANRSSHVPQ